MSDPRPTPDVVPLATTCVVCGAPFESFAVTLGGTGEAVGRQYITQHRCPTCVAKSDETREREERIQREATFRTERNKHVHALAVPPYFHLPDEEGVRGVPTLAAAARGVTSAPHRAALAACRSIVDGVGGRGVPPLLMALMGSYGAGKSLLAWATAAEVAGVRCLPARVVKLPTMVRDIREAWTSREGLRENARIRQYTDPAFLGIDEVSQHAAHGDPSKELYAVLDARLEALRPTIITTNETQRSLAEFLGPALWDRLREGGIIDLGTTSFRGDPSRFRDEPCNTLRTDWLHDEQPPAPPEFRSKRPPLT